MANKQIMIPFDSEIAKIISQTACEAMAKMLVEVQPMAGSIDGIFENSENEADLMVEGYRPACSQFRLTWVKDD